MKFEKVINHGDTSGSRKFLSYLERPDCVMRHEGNKYTLGDWDRYVWLNTEKDTQMNIDVSISQRAIKYEPFGHSGSYFVCKNSDDFDYLYKLIKDRTVDDYSHVIGAREF